jgi:hypothetical protein
LRKSHSRPQARLGDAASQHQGVVVVESRREVGHEVAHERLPALGQVFSHAAEAKPAGVHAGAGDRRRHVVDALAVAEHVEDGRQRADVLGEGAVEQKVAVHPVEL